MTLSKTEKGKTILDFNEARDDKVAVASVGPYANHFQTSMWANAQCDGCPAEYRWRPLFNATKFG